MPASIKHIRGTREEWLYNDPVVPDGVIALSMESGGYNIVVGDGKTPFSELCGTRARVNGDFTDYSVDVVINDGDDLRMPEVEDLYIRLPYNPPEDFSAMVTFFCGEYGTMLSYPADTKIFFSGADVVDREFVPQNMNRYTLFFWYDGRMQCNVRGVRYDYDD